jgi:hypothetical protein
MIITCAAHATQAIAAAERRAPISVRKATTSQAAQTGPVRHLPRHGDERTVRLDRVRDFVQVGRRAGEQHDRAQQADDRHHATVQVEHQRPCSAAAPPTRFTSSRQPPFAASSTPSILLAVHDHPVVGDQPVQRGVERARAQPDPAGRDLLDVEQDPVAVLGPGRERGQDEEGRLSERAVCHVIGGKRRQPAMLTIQ